MQRQVNFRDRQELQSADLSNIQLFPRETLDTLIADNEKTALAEKARFQHTRVLPGHRQRLKRLYRQRGAKKNPRRQRRLRERAGFDHDYLALR